MNPNDSAFPVEYKSGMAEIKTLGLTKCEYFAVEMMKGLLANPSITSSLNTTTPRHREILLEGVFYLLNGFIGRLSK